MRSFCVSAIASNQGKTILTTALLWHFRGDVRAYKIGPDFIDPQFHQKVTQTPSINLDSYIMNQKQVKWIYNHYADKPIGILEGVMGFYDGEIEGVVLMELQNFWISLLSWCLMEVVATSLYRLY